MRRVVGQALAIALWVATPALAGGLPQDKTEDLLPSAGAFTPEELSKNFGRQQFTPYGDSKFFFEILIPNSWESRLSEVDPDQLAHDAQAPVPMAEFGPAGADDVGLQVQYMRVPEQSGLAAFMDKYAQTNGGTIVVRHALEVEGRAGEEALMKMNSDDLGPMLARVAVIRRGEFVFIVSGSATEEKYEKYKRAFGAVVNSFDPSGK
jgi:hypothetical protein